jgi:hypothetical protein
MTIGAEERFINAMAADLEVLRLIQAAQLVRLGQVRPEALAELQQTVLQQLGRAIADTPPGDNAHRAWQLTLQRAQEFFADVTRLSGQPQNTPDASKAN